MRQYMAGCWQTVFVWWNLYLSVSTWDGTCNTFLYAEQNEIQCFMHSERLSSFSWSAFYLAGYLTRRWFYLANALLQRGALQRCQNERGGVLNHQRLHCVFNVCSGTDQRKNQSSPSLAFVSWIHWWPVGGFLSQKASNAGNVSI